MNDYSVDSHYLIGRSHINSGKPCQDHTLSGSLNGGGAFAIVADGCSSGRHTDMGARLMTFVTAKAIRSQWELLPLSKEYLVPEEIAFGQCLGIGDVKKTLDLDFMDLLATCAYVFVSPKGGLVHIQGDGVFAYKLRNGDIFMSLIDWQNKAPYLAYAQDGFAGFIRSQGGDVDALALTVENWKMSSGGILTELPQENISLGKGVCGNTAHFTAEQFEDIDCIAVFTDGVTQIDNLKWQVAVSQLLAFKTTTGEYATRRLNRMVKDAEKIGKGPIDDIGYGVVTIPKPQPKNSDANQITKES